MPSVIDEMTEAPAASTLHTSERPKLPAQLVFEPHRCLRQNTPRLSLSYIMHRAARRTEYILGTCGRFHEVPLGVLSALFVRNLNTMGAGRREER